MSRRTLDEGKKREIIAILSIGGSQRVAAAYVGCAHSTIWSEARRDPEFAKRLRNGRGFSVVHYLKRVHRAAGDSRHWRAAAWMLERLDPDHFGPRKPNTLTQDQVGQLLDGFGHALAESIPDLSQREAVLARLKGLMEPQQNLPQIEGPADAQ